MARLDKMLLSGVRSFGSSDGDEQAITFDTPLTLILGQNGCGKTTIIESLKVATCGEYPPGSSAGKNFVHDPKCANRTEVNGHIKLNFYDAKKTHYVVVRNFSLTQKAKTSSFTTRDNMVSKILEDRVEPVNSRCTDINLLMCDLLGVSKPILNNVIFCHQDDSDWPLGEPKKLKERFDAIFDATKYNKCVDMIIKMRKETTTKLNLMVKDLARLKMIKDDLTDKRLTKRNLEGQIVNIEEQVKVLKESLEPVMSRLNEIGSKETNIMKINTDRVQKKTRLDGLRELQKDLRSNLGTVFEGTLEDLKDAISNFEQDFSEKENTLRTLEESLKRSVDGETRSNRLIITEQVKVGQLQKEEEQNNNRVEERNRCLNRIAQDLGIAITQYTQLSDTQLSGLLTQVDAKIRTCRDEFESLQIQLESSERKLQENIDEFRDRKVKLDGQVQNKKQDLANNKDEIRKVKQELDEVDRSAENLVLLEAKVERANKQLQELTEALDVDTTKESIQTHLQTRNKLEEKLDLIDKEVQVLQLQSTSQVELNVQRDAKIVKENEIRKLKNKHEDALLHLFKTLPEEGFKYELQACHDRLIHCIKNLNMSLSQKKAQVTTLETNLRHKKERLRDMEEELRSNEETIYNVCGIEPYEDALHKITLTKDDLQDNTGTMSASQVLCRRYISKLQQKDPNCPVCHRNFTDENSVQEIVQELSATMREGPARLQKLTAELEVANKKYDTLQQMKPTHHRVARLKDVDIPNLRSELNEIEQRLGESNKAMDEIESKLLEPQLDEEMVKNVQSDVILLDQHIGDVKKLTREIEKLESKLPSGVSTRSMPEALKEQQQTRTELITLRRLIEETRTKLTTHNDRLQQLGERKNALIEEQLRIQGGVSQRKQLSDRIEELQLLQCVISEDLDHLQSEVGPVRSSLEAAVRERDESKRGNRSRTDESRSELAERSKRVDEVKNHHRQIEEYQRRGVSAKVSAAQHHLGKLQAELDQVRLEKEQLSDRMDAIKRDLSQQEVCKRNLEDNLKLREKSEEERNLAEEVKSLEKKLGGLDYRSIQAEKQRLRTEEEEIHKEKHVAEGRQTTLEESLMALKRELLKEQYKNAEALYLDGFIEEHLEREANSDLQKFSSAMEWAMIQFHQERMKSINMIIRELWRQIYRGNDIDHIEIKTEASESTSKLKRVYNYRVVQWKNEVELDMRGRCSAGQKVLACLIIRIALAETFSTTCGILTLDEPTTNLDKENIESLSRALGEIVNTKMAQRNFQLVVITHDEEFLESLTRLERVRYYYKVDRDRYGKSVIRKYKAGSSK